MSDGATPQSDGSSDLIYDPVSESPFKRWLLLNGSREAISIGLAIGVFLTVLALYAAGILRVRNADAVQTLLAALVGGTLPFITIVLAINQLVLAQELGWTAELQDRFQGMVSFRREVEPYIEQEVSPASPADFLKEIVIGTVSCGRTLSNALAADAGADIEQEVETFSEALSDEGEVVIDTLDDAQFGTFNALSAVLGHHQGEHLYTARKLRFTKADAFTDTAPLDELIELLEYLAIARQTFKTLYVEHELAVLSRLLLYVGFPTLVGGGLLVIIYPTLVEIIGTTHLLAVIAAIAVMIVFLPFFVLVSYALRIATIAARTADFGPFVPSG